MSPIMADKSNTQTNNDDGDNTRSSAAATSTYTHKNDAATAATTAPTTLNLQTCTPQALAEWLLQHRFREDDDDDDHNDNNNNEMNVTHFLLQAISSLPNAQAISDQFMMNDDGNEQAKTATAAAEPEKEATATTTTTTAAAAAALDLGKELLAQPAASTEVSLTVPRTKAVVTWYAAGIRFVDKKQQSFTLLPGTVERMILFPKPEDCQPKKKIPSDLVLLVLKSNNSSVVFKNKAVKQVCLQLPADLPTWNKKKEQAGDCDDDGDDDDSLDDWSNLDHTDQWTQVFCQSLGLDARTQTARVWNPSSSATSFAGRYQFTSHQEENTSTTTGGMPFVQCYCGVNDGVLYPLVDGLLFFKPPLFVPRSALHSIACGRGGGGGNSRYVDLTVEMEASDSESDSDEDVATKTLEFTNIHRSELTVMREYIHKTLIPAMQKDVAGDGGASNNEEPQKESNSDDVDADAGEEESSSSNRRGGKRKASAEARAVTKKMQIESDGDEDDDDDYGEDEHDDEEMSEAEDEEESEEDDNEGVDEDEEGADTESEGEE